MALVMQQQIQQQLMQNPAMAQQLQQMTQQLQSPAGVAQQMAAMQQMMPMAAMMVAMGMADGARWASWG